MEKEPKLQNIKENKEHPISINELWIEKDGTRLSPLVLDAFGKFLMSRPEYRKGDMAFTRANREEPLEVIFFADDPNSNEDVYLITHDYKRNVLEVKKLKDRTDKITPLLEEFGLTQSLKE